MFGLSSEVHKKTKKYLSHNIIRKHLLVEMSRICQLDICPRLPTNKILDSNGNGLTTEASVL